MGLPEEKVRNFTGWMPILTLWKLCEIWVWILLRTYKKSSVLSQIVTRP